MGVHGVITLPTPPIFIHQIHGFGVKKNTSPETKLYEFTAENQWLADEFDLGQKTYFQKAVVI